MKRSHKKRSHVDPITPEDWAKVQAQPGREDDPATHRGRDVETPKPPDDGEAKTAAEPVPVKRRGRPPGSKTKPKVGNGIIGPEGELRLDPQLAKVAALGPMMLAAGIGSRFFGVLLPYDPDTIQSAQFQFEKWMDELGLKLGPGWQYGALCCIAIGKGIRDAEPITKEMRDAMLAHKAQMKAEAKAAREAAAKPAAPDVQKNGVAPAPAAAPVPQDVPESNPEAKA